MPEYPGAQRSVGSMKMKTASASVVTASFATANPLAQGVDFYKEKLGDSATLTERGSSIALAVGQSDVDRKIITIRRQGDLTRITMMHTSRTP